MKYTKKCIKKDSKSCPLSVIILLIVSTKLQAQEILLYNIRMLNNDSIGFVSFSDTYPLSNHPDSSAIPDIENMDKASAQHFILNSKYRKRFLSQLKISENDKVFIYDYAGNQLINLDVKKLAVVAYLNFYLDPDGGPYLQSDYMIGFSLDTNSLKKIRNNIYTSFVYVGKQNPFEIGKIKPIIWEKIDSKKFPSDRKDSKKDSILNIYGHKIYGLKDVHKYVSDGFEYFIQDGLNINNEISTRHLLVIKSNTNEIVCEQLYFDSEGTSLAPLNGEKTNYNNPKEQFTGVLFKNKAPVVFGFEYHSFGCEFISFLNPNEPDIYINCDNRH